MMSFEHRRVPVPLAGAIALAALLIAGPAVAQYKVVGPGGKVTYTDRAPNSAEARITALGAKNAPIEPDVDLPFELRQPAARYPVTLYVASGACEPCELGRNLLRQRGIPYTEKLVKSAEDTEALEKISGSRDAPTLAIGSQVVRGMSPDLWNSYLDAAGYPRQSKLPAGYQYRPATPLVEHREAAAARPAPRAEPDILPIDRPLVTSGGIRF